MSKYRNGKKENQPALYDTVKKITIDEEESQEVSFDQVSESECQNCMIESDTLIQCELWLCCDCQLISPNMLKAIKQFKTLHWFCKVCEPDVQEFLHSAL